ncbi:hypothetical protein BH10PAT1_BH10PAT1_3820 [soil metagenome]
MTDKSSKQQRQKQVRQANILEALKDIGGNTGKTIKEDLFKEGSAEFMRQLLGLAPKKKFSGEISKGENLVVGDVFSGKQEEVKKAQKQIRFERRILEEEKAAIENKSNDLKLRLHAITQEIQGVVLSTPKLARQVEVASLTATNAPGIYHVMFLEKILEFLKSFKKDIESASNWLAATNKRANKRNFWNQYKTQKGTALLNPETYNSRSAG